MKWKMVPFEATADMCISTIGAGGAANAIANAIAAAPPFVVTDAMVVAALDEFVKYDLRHQTRKALRAAIEAAIKEAGR